MGIVVVRVVEADSAEVEEEEEEEEERRLGG